MNLSTQTTDLLTSAQSLGLPLAAEQAELMLAYLQAVLHENEQINVTSIRDPQLALTQHLLDSLTVVAWWRSIGQEAAPQRILDLGTGGGFPAAPLAVYWPHAHVMAIDGTGKKIGVVQRCAEVAGIRNLTALHVRGKDLPKLRPNVAGSFDLLTARAVGPARELLKELLPLTAPGGKIALLKGESLPAEEELAASRYAGSKGLLVLKPWKVTAIGLEARQILGYRR